MQEKIAFFALLFVLASMLAMIIVSAFDAPLPYGSDIAFSAEKAIPEPYGCMTVVYQMQTTQLNLL